MGKKKEQPYNRIVLIGNGFDKALGLNTSYSDFILDYLIKNIIEAFENRYNKNTDLVSIELRSNYGTNHKGVQFFKELSSKKTVKDLLELVKPFISITYKYKFFKDIVWMFENANWVDIEQYYYEKLKLLSVKRLAKELNECMDLLTIALNDFISKQEQSITLIHERHPMIPLLEKVKNPLKNDQIKLVKRHNKIKAPEKVLFLNFNYTNSVQNMLFNSNLGENYWSINIHGKVDDEENPIIFGFGNDTDETYKILEAKGENEWLRMIKSFKYPRTNNYQKLLAFLEYAEYDIFVVGHSCGLSDKTLLKTIFEHDHCLAIQNFHYRSNGEAEDFEKRIDISRHFSDKFLMRERLLSFDEYAKIPQVQKDSDSVD